MAAVSQKAIPAGDSPPPFLLNSEKPEGEFPTTASNKIDANDNPNGNPRRRTTWLEIVLAASNAGLVIVGIIAAVIYTRQLTVIRGTFAEMERSQNAVTDQTWRATEILNESRQILDLNKRLSEAAGAALNASRIQSVAAISEQRAAVSAAGIAADSDGKLMLAVRLDARQTNPLSGLIVAWQWENSGPTPTMNAETVFRGAAFDAPITRESIGRWESIHPLEVTRTSLRAHSKVATLPIFIPFTTTTGKTIVVWGKVTYNDIFKETPLRLSEFCFQLVDLSWTGKPPETVTTKAGWKLCPILNCADEGCEDYKEAARQ